jgi:D-alanyl-D-alanine dipeptidase
MIMPGEAAPIESTVLIADRRVSPPEVAPHSAGAAIDRTLCADDGTELDLATLAESLHAAGLVNYPTEWWHWSYGDRYWAMATGAPRAIYAAANRR